MNETDLSKCKVCGEVKKRILVGKFDDRNKKYVDESGRLYNGRTCPVCHSNKVKLNMQKLRFKKKVETATSPDVQGG